MHTNPQSSSQVLLNASCMHPVHQSQLSTLSTLQNVPSASYPTFTYPNVQATTTGVSESEVPVMSSYYGRGPLPPNVYQFTTAQPKYSVSMGACNVQAVGSHLQNHAGRFVSCGSRDDRPVPRCT